MENVKWYLDKITSQIPGFLEKQSVREEIREHLEDHAQRLMARGVPEEMAWRQAVEAMGDSDELAEQMGKIHSYDTSAAFSWTIGMMWIGMMLCFIHIGSETMQAIEEWAGRIILLIALFRLSEINQNIRKAFHCHAASCAAVIFIFAAQVLMWENVQNIGGGIFTIIDTAFCMGMVYWLVNGVYHLADEREQRYLDIWLIVEMIMGIIGIAVMIFVLLAGGSYQERLTIELDGNWFGALGLFLTFGLIGATLFWCAAFIVGSVRVKRNLQDNLETGIGPFDKRKAVPYLVMAVGVIAVPFVTAAIISLWPVNGTLYLGAMKAEPDAWAKTESVIKESVTQSEDELLKYVELIGTILPKEEILSLQDAKKIELMRDDTVEQEEGITRILIGAELPPSHEGRIFYAGCLNVIEPSKAGFSGISSFWIQGDRDYNTYPVFIRTGEDRKAVLLYEKGGELYQFEPRIDYGRIGLTNSQMTAVEYTIKQDADVVYCYQTLSICRFDENEEEQHGMICMGSESAVQKSLFRVPYDTVEYQWADGGAYRRDHNTMLVFYNGMVGDDENWLWKKRGYLNYFEY